MKKLFLLFTLAFIALSCEQIQDFIDEKGHGLVFLEGEMKAYFDDKGDTKNYKFKADLAWSAEVSADWVEVDPTSGPAGENKIQIKVDKNKSNERRTGYVDITLSNDKNYRIELEQMAAGESLDDIIDPTTSIPNNEIWYTNGSTTEPTQPYNTSTFDTNIISNEYDAKKGCWVIKFDGDVTSVGFDAFAFCRNLTSIAIPDSVTSIGVNAFYGCRSLTSVTIPDNVTTIGDTAFGFCYSLIGVTIPDSVTTIGEWAFGYCSSLTSVTIPDSVTIIGDGIFAGCSNLTEFNGKYATEDGRCLIIDGTLNSFAPAELTEYTIPDSVTTIGDYAFDNCGSLTSITIPNSVTTIGDWAFYCCNNLTSITIPDSVTTIRGHAFFVCRSLTSVTIGDSVTSIGDWAFSECSSLTSITIPDSVTTIGINAFCGCSNLREFNGKYASEDGRCLIFNSTLNSFAPAGLTEYTIPDSVTTIGGYAFYYCSNLISITIPDSVTTIEFAAFYGCSSLTSVVIPDSVTTIGYEAFYNCSSLTSVTIPDSVTTIGDCAFARCSSLTSVYCKAVTPPAVGYDMFYDNASDRKIYVPTESVEAYKSSSYWSEYADDIVGYDF